MIKNISTRRLLAKNPISCKSAFSKALGLMFSIRPKALIFFFNQEKIISLHMFFVFFPIDVLWLNKEQEVVEKKTLQPFQLYTPKNRAKFVIEFPVGTIAKSNTEIGHTISFK